ncbi:MAG: M24 family metallopeptidase, partial [Candidatus Aenigmatarchaeota archaeon]
MEPQAFEKYKKAGKIVRDIFGSLKVQPGTKILALADDIEAELVRKGAKPAFPVNISINEVAAHYTPEFGDETSVKPGDIVKVDIGAHIDGYIADASVSYCSEKNSNESAMIKASEAALEQALKFMVPGKKICEISEIIESEIISKGFVPVGNLTGHALDQYMFHG